ncbi:MULTISPECIES: ABC transporter ATP-binding protein [unclassified Bradyrhizobium]|uniref:ABC transporter ATP-binding protein n=1 Tax=unclassified Bradyrhizobium TaxID=2631580 RepID=UPI001CD31846|nr:MULTISPECIES: ABC transporter ATP-binding protein [unclassified Bradyrhizobium]
MSSLKEEIHYFLDRLRGKRPARRSGEFYALRDVTFSIPVGSVCGIIGRNGSGKTTLLKVLTSITEPDEGEARLRGRVGSLLEVGAGFHPELDGIENIYLNGGILGMSRSEITSKLDRIIEFADVGAVMETPVKRYSSGMYVRLAFAIAAYLEPDILLVDEVLAVGDADFQRKSLAKMKDAAGEGRTVLFVSHNMAMVRQLCDMAIFLEEGCVKQIGPSSAVIDRYLLASTPQSVQVQRTETDAVWGELRVVEPSTETVCPHLKFGGDYDFVLRLGAKQPFKRGVAQVRILDQEGVLISSLESLAEGVDQFDISEVVEVVFSVRSLGLLPGTYLAGYSLYAWGEEEARLSAEACLSFEVIPATVNDAYWPYLREHGIVRLAHSANLRYPLLSPQLSDPAGLASRPEGLPPVE